MTHNDDPPWLRPPPVVVLPASTDGKKSSQVSISSGAAPKANSPPTFPPTTRNSENTSSLTLLPSPQIASAGPSSSRAEDDEEQYTGWRPQQMTAQQIAHTPPLSPLDLAMYPGAPAISDPAAARRAVAGLRPLRILSSRRPGGPASAGPSRPPSVEATNSATRSSFMGFFSAAKRASVTTLAGPSSSPSRGSTQSTPISHTPIPVSPLPPPRTPPLVPKLALGPELTTQVEPALREYLEVLAAQAAAKPSSSPRRISTSQPTPPATTFSAPEEEMVLEIRDLDAGRVIKIRDLDAVASSDAVNRKSQSTSQRPPSISEFMVVRDLDAQPHTLPPLSRPQRQRNRTPEQRLLTPPRSLSPIKPRSPVLPIPSPRRSPITPLSEAVYVNHNLELSLSKLENALYVARKSHSRTDSNSTFTSTFSPGRDETSRTHAMQTPKTAHTSTSHVSSMFSSRTLGSPLTTPPASPPPLPRLKDIALPCMVCARPMQNMTSTRCGHVFCRGCVEGRSACPICRASVEQSDLRAIYLFV